MKVCKESEVNGCGTQGVFEEKGKCLEGCSKWNDKDSEGYKLEV